MTKAARVALKDLFGIDPGVLASEIHRNEKLKTLKDTLSRGAKHLDWSALIDGVTTKLVEALDIDLWDVFTTAWNKYRALEKYTDHDRYPPDQTVIVELAKHSVTSQHAPYVDILVNEQSIGRIVFDVTAVIVLEALQLEIRDGRIRRVMSGACTGNGTIAIAGATIAHTPFPKIRLPGSIGLGEGIPLGRRRDRLERV